MSAKPKKKSSSDLIFVKGHDENSHVRNESGATNLKPIQHDDITLLALQLSCSKRLESSAKQHFENVHEINNIVAITVETRMFSSLILIGSSSSKVTFLDLAAKLSKQLHSIIRSAHEKIYFIEHFQLLNPSQLDWNFFVKMSDYCFMQENSKGPSYVGYFRLEKAKDDERFANRSITSMSDGEVAEQDVYLYFAKNNRYIKILNKGEALEKRKIDQLESKGVKDLYISSDQGIETQQRRVRLILLDLLEDYSTLTSAI